MQRSCDRRGKALFKNLKEISNGERPDESGELNECQDMHNLVGNLKLIDFSS